MIGIIGLGNLGTALLQGLINHSRVDPHEIMVCSKTTVTIENAINQYKVRGTNSFSELMNKADVVFLVLKKKVFNEEVMNRQKGIVTGKIIISLMSGMKMNELKHALGNENEFVRMMPNLSINKGRGFIPYHGELNDEVIQLIETLGEIFKVKEEEIEKLTIYSASGLGFAAHIINSCIEAGKSLGIPQELCDKVARNIFTEASKAENINSLVERVTTKGGITEAGIKVLESGHIKEIIKLTLRESYTELTDESY